jgi:hypothetical protein
MLTAVRGINYVPNLESFVGIHDLAMTGASLPAIVKEDLYSQKLMVLVVVRGVQ